MKIRMDEILSLWVGVIREQAIADYPDLSKKRLTRRILADMEGLGSARRRLDCKGRIVWEATASLQEFLRDRELDALDDLDDE
jgi:hypothetical protein